VRRSDTVTGEAPEPEERRSGERLFGAATPEPEEVPEASTTTG